MCFESLLLILFSRLPISSVKVGHGQKGVVSGSKDV
jgi:hypothetical protein